MTGHGRPSAAARFSGLALALLLPVGCQLGYVCKQAFRQLDLLGRQIPLEHLPVDRLSEETREKLLWVPRILEFCRKELGLEPGNSYRAYLDTGGQPITFIVTASHPLALIPYQWSFPFVGRVPYKGFFEEDEAREEEKRLQKLGYDTAVFPVGAFSTLGWFPDPVLSTMLEGDIAELADLLIHETTHRTVYFHGWASFNESLATHVAREGTVRFLFSRPELRSLLPGYLDRRRRQMARERLLIRLRDDLDALYRTSTTAEEKRLRKAELFKTADRALRLLPGTPAEAATLSPSNAFVLSVARYYEYRRLFQRLQLMLDGTPADLVAYLRRVPSGKDPAAIIEKELAKESL